MYAQVKPLKIKPVKAPKKKNSQGKESTKENEFINHCIEHVMIHHELLVQ